ncbi:hypothetical protein ACFO9Q_13290 [Paenibacillus sp. GCM10023252]|uniref:hypothetical protein n=1 Tax=Paenibacillus sp. GCM10023252 TaxID=3252649 RepID=UPI00360B7B9A
MLLRKFITAFMTTWVTLLWLPEMMHWHWQWDSWDDERLMHGDEYVSTASVLAMYVVPIVSVYGVLVSIVVEKLLNPLRIPCWLHFILWFVLHGLFGVILSFMGIITAITYAVIDYGLRWMIEAGKLKRRRSVIVIATMPVVLFLGWYLLHFILSPEPPKAPFTAEQAVEFATWGEGSNLSKFPKQIGQEQLNLAGYDVKRMTEVEETAMMGVYEVIFTEEWKKGLESGTFKMMYRVYRGGMELQEEEGEIPPY